MTGTVEDQVFDVAVIGAGIIGAACAFRLADAGVRVVVLEKEGSAATGSTGASAAGVRVQFAEPTNIELSLRSIHEYQRFDELFGRGSEYRPVGYLLLVPRHAWEQHLEAVDTQRGLGAPVEVLDIAAARRRFLDFRPDGLGGATFGPVDGVVDPHSVTFAYLDAARSRGAEIAFRWPVTAFRRDAESWGIASHGRGLRAHTVVNAAGCWAGEVAGLAGLRVPVEPVRRTVFVTAPTSGRPTTPLTVDLTTGLYFRSEGERLIFGRSNPDQDPGFVSGVDWEWLDPTIDAAVDRFPWFADERLDRAASWHGYYEVTPDHGPVLGRDERDSSWVNACGFSGHGVQQAPAIGRVIAEEVIDGRASTIDIDAFRGSRFATTVTTPERHII